MNDQWPKIHMTSINGGSRGRGSVTGKVPTFWVEKCNKTKKNQKKRTEKVRKSSISCNFSFSLIFVCIHLYIVNKQSYKGSVPLTLNYAAFQRTASSEQNHWRYFYIIQHRRAFKNVIALNYFIILRDTKNAK